MDYISPEFLFRIAYNGPAVGFSKRYPTQAPPQICPGRPESCHGARRVRRGFCHPGTSFIDHYACRGTKLISGTNLSRCNKCYKMGTGAVSVYKLFRSQKSVKVQDFNCGQMRLSGCKNHYKAVLVAGASR